MVALLDALGIEQVNYFGISMGGRIGQNLALRFPQCLASLGLITTTYRSERGGTRPAHSHSVAARSGCGGSVAAPHGGPPIEVELERYFEMLPDVGASTNQIIRGAHGYLFRFRSLYPAHHDSL